MNPKKKIACGAKKKAAFPIEKVWFDHCKYFRLILEKNAPHRGHLVLDPKPPAGAARFWMDPNHIFKKMDLGFGFWPAQKKKR